MDCREQTLLKIQGLQFKALELNLFLDTHPSNVEALREYNRTHEQLQILKRDYEQKYGPLFNFGFSPSSYPWQWVEEPWPWEN